MKFIKKDALRVSSNGSKLFDAAFLTIDDLVCAIFVS